MKIGIYVRASTRGQTIEQQEKTLTDYAKARNWIIYKIFKDEGLSGTKVDRPGYLDLMATARKRYIDGVLVFKFDRFARTLKQLISGLDEFRQLDVEFISFTESVDTTTPAGRAMFQLIAVFAEFERAMISEATKERLAALKALGKTLGRPVKVNYEEIRKFAMENEGMTQRAIAEKLGVSVGTVNKAFKKGGVKNPKESK